MTELTITCPKCKANIPLTESLAAPLLEKPWRVFYRVADRSVYVVLIADGRRELRNLLGQRLLDA